jgi:glutaredoxin 3
MVKEFLSRERQAFTVRNIEEDPAAYDELLALGFKVVPVTLVDGDAITGFDEPALRRALAAPSKS